MNPFNPEVPDDWQMNRSLRDCAAQLFTTHHLSDITFVFPEEQPRVRIPAHKFILAIRSPVFETMFYGALPPSDTVSIVDNPSSAFKALLRFIYTDSSEFSTCSEALETMAAAHKYRIPLLAEICASFLEKAIHTEDVCSVLDQALLYDFYTLQSCCRNFVEENANQVFKTEGFKMMSAGALAFILESEDLSLDEYEIYQAAVDWAGVQCSRQELPVTGENRRKVLGKAFYQLRLPHIPLETFSKVVSREGLLTNEEVIDLFRFHVTEQKETLEFVNCVKRKSSSVMVIARMMDGLRRNNMPKGWRTETIKFQVNISDPKLEGRQAQLVGLGLTNILIKTDMEDEYFATQHLVSVELEDLYLNSGSDSEDEYYDRNVSKDLGVSSVSLPFTSKESNYITVELPKPIDLIDGRWYRLEVTLYSRSKTVLKGKSYIKLLGSAVKTKVTLSSGLKALFHGSSHGPIHSLHVKLK